ncbi:MAG: EAL domain-containing protein [Oscillospiraceae bacterium]|nr:EAL domain-containing protein [Oscillospiraceae bacterium]
MTYDPAKLKRLIDDGDLIIEFQPIYSLNTQKYIGLEALARGSSDGEIIPPIPIFEHARHTGRLSELDRICREKAMMSFSRQGSAPQLFLNFDADILNSKPPLKGEILRAAQDNHILPQNIIIEVDQSKVTDIFDLMMFVDYYRSRGFLIALDNVGAGAETIDHVMFINPDVIKIDRSVVADIDSDKYKREIFRSIISTAKKIGAMTVAEGTERVDEVITCMIMGVDYFQGFYFQKPDRFNYLFTNEARMRVEDAAKKLNISTKNNETITSIRIESYKRTIYDLINRLLCMEGTDHESELREYVNEHSEIECAYLIDKKGFQITDTIMSDDTVVHEGYHPAIKGVNHDIKNYFYAIKEQIEDPFISGWYISNATGNSCKTISSKMYDRSGNMIVVCVDLKSR